MQLRHHSHNRRKCFCSARFAGYGRKSTGANEVMEMMMMEMMMRRRRMWKENEADGVRERVGSRSLVFTPWKSNLRQDDQRSTARVFVEDCLTSPDGKCSGSCDIVNARYEGVRRLVEVEEKKREKRTGQGQKTWVEETES
eukprot:763395-Hanusia_phi.AAC.12